MSKTNGINGKTTEPTVVSVRPQIYINPRFLGQQSIQGIGVTQQTITAPIVINSQENYSQLTAQEYHESIALVAEPLADTKIHTRTKIIKPSVKQKVANLPIIENVAPNSNAMSKSLIKIGSKKLVRIPTTKTYAKSTKTATKTITKLRRPLQTKYKIVKEQTAFKIDRRSAKAKLASITKRTAPLVPTSKKLWINESLMPTKMVKWYD